MTGKFTINQLNTPHGNCHWRVEGKIDGKRMRAFYRTKPEAEEAARRRNIEVAKTMRGGYRPGSGRPQEERKVSVIIRLRTEVARLLRATVPEKTRSQWVEELIVRGLAEISKHGIETVREQKLIETLEAAIKLSERRMVESFELILKRRMELLESFLNDGLKRPDRNQMLNKGGTMPDAQEDKRLTAKEVAEKLGLDRQTIYNWAKSGRIPCIKFRHRMRFHLGDIERWEKQQTFGKF